MVAIFWLQLTIMLSALAWDVYHFLDALSYGRELKWKGVSLLQRFRDELWREKWHAAVQDTAYSIACSWFCEMIMPYMAGATAGMLIGLAFSVSQRRQAKRRQQFAASGR